ncbi:MAG: hypothetical protein MK135_03550 [Polyangiaceae bacterium]|nr:hypothetical protein [Polyangiaceae bacterium]
MSDAYLEDITTYLVFIGTPPSLDPSVGQHLQKVANLGIGLPADESVNPAEYFTANNQSGLDDAFSKIVVQARSCLFGENGWRVVGESTIELLGSACESINSGQKVLDIDFPCDVYTPPQIR